MNRLLEEKLIKNKKVIKTVREWINMQNKEFDCNVNAKLKQKLIQNAEKLSAKNTLILSKSDWKSYFSFIINHNMSDEIAEHF